MLLYGFNLIFISLLYLFNIVCMFSSVGSPMFSYPGFSFLGVLSILLFSTIIILVTVKIDLFFFFLPFVILAFPNVINDLLPSFLMGPPSEYRVASFSYITHIDLYLIYGIYLNKNQNLRLPRYQNFKPLILFTSFLLIYFILTVLSSKSIESLSLFATGNYQLRYAILFFLLIGRLHLNDCNMRFIIYGLSLSIIFLFIESAVFTISTGRSTLGSGTLAANVYANITAALTMFFIFLKRESFRLPELFYTYIRAVTIAIGFLILVLNGTRIAMFSFFLVFIIYYLRTSLKKRSFLKFFGKMVSYFLFFSFLLLIAMQFERFRGALTILIDILNSNIKLNESTASLFARMHLFKVSINMINENWLLGIGPGRWNFFKYDYDYQNIGTLLVDTLMDPHNDYLSYLSQYGLFTGSFMIFFVLIRPSFQFLKKPEDSFLYFGLIPLTLLISGLTNSNTLKHQIFATMMLVVLIMYQKVIKNESIYSNN